MVSSQWSSCFWDIENLFCNTTCRCTENYESGFISPTLGKLLPCFYFVSATSKLPERQTSSNTLITLIFIAIFLPFFTVIFLCPTLCKYCYEKCYRNMFTYLFYFMTDLHLEIMRLQLQKWQSRSDVRSGTTGSVTENSLHKKLDHTDPHLIHSSTLQKLLTDKTVAAVINWKPQHWPHDGKTTLTLLPQSDLIRKLQCSASMWAENWFLTKITASSSDHMQHDENHET